MADRISKIYANACKKGVLNPERQSEDWFRQQISTEKGQKSFYDFATQNGMKFHPYEEWQQHLNDPIDDQPAQAAAPSTPASQAPQDMRPSFKDHKAPTNAAEEEANMRLQEETNRIALGNNLSEDDKANLRMQQQMAEMNNRTQRMIDRTNEPAQPAAQPAIPIADSFNKAQRERLPEIRKQTIAKNMLDETRQEVGGLQSADRYNWMKQGEGMTPTQRNYLANAYKQDPYLEAANSVLFNAEVRMSDAKRQNGISWKNVGEGLVSFGKDTSKHLLTKLEGMASFGMSDVRNAVYQRNVLKKVADANAFDNPETVLTPKEKALYDATITSIAVEIARQNDTSRWSKAGQITADMIPFIEDIMIGNALFKGFGDAGREAIKKGVEKHVRNKLAKWLLTNVGDVAISAGESAATAAILPHTYAEMYKNTAQADMDKIGMDGDFRMKLGGIKEQDFGKSWAQAYGNEVKELFTETGGNFRLIGRALIDNPIGKKILKTPFGMVLKRFEGAQGGAGSRFASTTMYHGVLGEWLEELEGAIYDGNLKDFFTADTQLPMLLSFSVPAAFTGGLNATQQAFYQAKYDQAGKRIDKLIDASSYLGPDKNTIKGQILATLYQTPTENLPQAIGMCVEQVYPEEYKALMEGAPEKGNKAAELSYALKEYLTSGTVLTIFDPDMIGGQIADVQAHRQQMRQQAEQNAQAEVQSISHEDGNIYRVGIKGKDGAEGYAFRGDLDVVPNQDGTLSTRGRDLITIKMTDGTVEQVPADEVTLLDAPASAADRVQAVADHLFAQYANNDLFQIGDKVHIMQNGQPGEDSSTIVNITDEGVEVEIIDPNGQPNTTIIPHEQAAEMLSKDETGTEDGIVTFTMQDGNTVRLRDMGDGTFASIVSEGEQPEIFTEEELTEAGAVRAEEAPIGESNQIPQRVAPAYPMDEEGNPAWNQIEVPQAAQILYDTFKQNNAAAISYADDQLKEAEKVQKKAASQKSHSLNIAQRIAEDEQNAQFKAAADAAVKYWQNVKQSISQIKSPEEIAAEEEKRAKDAAKAAARRQTEEGLVGGQPAERWNNAPKIVGNAVTRTLPDGTKIVGHYVLAEAGAATPSHNPFNNWNTSEGFPVTEDGRNINDRDYKNDKDAQQITMQIAQTYDGQAVQQVPVVSLEGIVYDGNGRTIAGNIAAANNTDAAYLQALTENAANFGFTPEQVASMQHPRVYLQTDEDMPYNTTTFAKFNAQEKKTMNSVQRAISNAKKLTDAARDGLLRVINSYSSLDAFFASENGAKDILNLLQSNNIITEQEAPEWRDNTEKGFVLSADGRSGITDLLIGALFDEQTIRMLGNDKGLKQSILRAMPSIVENRQLGDYALTDDINEAIRLLYEARQAGMVYKLFVRQGNLIDGYVKDRFSAFSMLLAEEMSSGVDKFRQVLDIYNNSARDDANGQSVMFDRRTPEDIKNQTLKRYEQEQQPAEPAGEQPARKEAQPSVPSAPASDEPAAEVTPEERLAQAEAETDTNPTEAQKKAENYKQGHVTLWGLPITIENPKGSIRRGTDANGKQWEQEMHHTYGKIRRTEGVDGDHIDVFIGPNLTSDKVFVVDQRNVDTGEFDEHKCMLGFDSLEEAQNGYLSNYEEGWQGMGTVTEVTMDEFKKWIDSSHRKTKPFAEYKSVKNEGAASVGYEEDDAMREELAEELRKFDMGERSPMDENLVYDTDDMRNAVTDILKRYNSPKLQAAMDAITATLERQRAAGSEWLDAEDEEQALIDTVREVVGDKATSVEDRSLYEQAKANKAAAERGNPVSKMKKDEILAELERYAEGNLFDMTPRMAKRILSLAKKYGKNLPEPIANMAVNAALLTGENSIKDTKNAKNSKKSEENAEKNWINRKNFVSLHRQMVDEAAAENGQTLTDEEKKNWDWLSDNIIRIVDEYKKANGNVLDPDAAREYFSPIGYDGSNVPQYRTLEKALVDALYSEMLDEALAQGKTKLVLLTGHGGAGKSTATRDNKRVQALKKEAGVVFDAAMNSFKSLNLRIQQAIDDHGVKQEDITIIPVYNDAVTSFENTLKRGIKTGRVLSIKYLLNDAFAENAGKLAKVHEKYPQIAITPIDNAENNGGREVSIDDALQWDYNVTESLINQILDKYEQYIKKGGLTPNQIATISDGLSDVEVTGGGVVTPSLRSRLERIGEGIYGEVGDGKDVRPEVSGSVRRPVEGKFKSGDKVIYKKKYPAEVIERNADGTYILEYPNNLMMPVRIMNAQESDIEPNTPPSGPAPTKKPSKTEKKSEFGSKNTIVTQDEAADLIAQLKGLLNDSKNLYAIASPQRDAERAAEITRVGTKLAMYYIEGGVRKFADFCKSMVDALGDEIRPYLKRIYAMARFTPEMEAFYDEMDDDRTVRAFDVDNFDYKERNMPEVRDYKDVNGQDIHIDDVSMSKSDGKLYYELTVTEADGKHQRQTSVSVDTFNHELETKGIYPANEQPKEEKPMSPMMKQFRSIKEQYPDATLMFRVGDFYELYEEDAVEASKILGITLTKRKDGRAFAGFPFHALDTYLPKLVRAGKRVAICDQLEDPKKAKGLVKRGVSELVTPGTPYQETPKVENTEVAEPESVTDNQEPTIPEPNVVTDTVGEITESKHTKTGAPIWVVKPLERVSDDEYKVLKARAKKNNGYYSRFVKGFVFNSVNDANRFNNISDEQTTTEQTSADTETAIKQAETVAATAETIETPKQVASKITPEAKEEQVTEVQQVIEQVDDAVEQINEQLAVLGYYEADTSDPFKFHESYGFLKSAEAKAVQDCDRLAKQLAADLGVEVNKRKKLATANIAPAGGDISFRLPIKDGLELYVHLGINPNRDLYYKPDGIQESYVISDMYWRVENPNANGSPRYLTGNQNYGSLYGPYGHTFPTYEKLLKDIRYYAKDYLPKVEEESAPVEHMSDLLEEAKKRKEASDKRKKDKTRIPDGQQVLSLFDDAVEDLTEAARQEEQLNDNNNGNINESTEGAGRTTPEGVNEVGSNGTESNGGQQTGSAQEPSGRRNTGRVAESDAGQDGGETQQPTTTGTEQPRSKRGGASGTAGGVSSGNVLEDPTIEHGDNRADNGSLRTPKEKNTPKNTRNYLYPEDAGEIDNMSPMERLETNVEALEVLRTLLTEEREATPEERATLGKLRGWGGINVPDNYTAKYTPLAMNPLQKRLVAVVNALDPNGERKLLESLRTASLTSYYTPIPIARAMHAIAEQAGYKGNGNMLDPSMGNGVFEGSMAKGVQQSTNIRGVELDWLTGQIAQKLYPDARINITGFQDAHIPQDYYDYVVSNIPFGSLQITDLDWQKNPSPIRKAAQGKIHNYFAVKMIESTRPGGLCVIMTSNAIMDTAGNDIIRKYITDNCEVLGAVRLPNNTFKGAGTRVVTDVIYLRKFRNAADRDVTLNNADYIENVKTPFEQPTVQELQNKNGVGIGVGYSSYYATHKDNLIGTPVAGGQYSDEAYDQESNLSTDELAQQLETIGRRFMDERKKRFGNITVNTTTPRSEIQERIKERYKGNGRYESSGNIVVQDGKIGKLEGTKEGNMTQLMFAEQKLGSATVAQVIDYANLRSLLKQLIHVQIENYTSDRIDEVRKQMQQAYTAYTKKYGKLCEKKNAFIEEDIDGYQVRALEQWKDGKFVGMADIYTKNTIASERDMNDVSDPQAAVLNSLAEYGNINTEYLKRVLGDNFAEACKGLIFEDPSHQGDYIARDVYLSGDVVTKLEYARQMAEEDSRFQENVTALEAIQPKRKEFGEFPCHMGARWIPVQIYNDFLNEIFGVRGNWKGQKTGITYVEATNEYIFNFVPSEFGGNAAKYATSRKSASDIFQAALLDKDITVKYKDDDGKEHTDQEATDAARDKVAELREAFEDWVPQKPERVQQLTDTYNSVFNRHVLPTYNGQHLNIVGLQGMKLRPHQKDAVWRIINQRGGIVDHIVGAGKSLVMQASIMEMRRMGIAKKPMILALKSTTQQIANEFRQAFPAARVLAPTEADFSTQNRKRFLAQIAVNDYDCIILSHEQYSALDHTEAIKRSFIEDQIAQLDNLLEYLYGQKDESQLTKKQIKGLEKRKENLKERLKKLELIRTDEEFVFENLGVDYLFVDECQAFKNLMFQTSYSQIAGLGNPEGSERSTKLLYGVRALQEMHQGDMGTVFLSGTTITNSLSELYNIFNYLRPNEMARMGLNTFDAWASTFAVRSTEAEFGATNELKEKSRFRKFEGLQELSRLYTEIADVRNDNNLELPKPKLHTVFVSIPISDTMKTINDAITDMVKNHNGSFFNIKPERVDKYPWSLSATNLAKLATLSPKLIDPSYDDENGKIFHVCENIKKIYDQFNDQKGVQLVFCDAGVPGPGKKYDAYTDIIRRLTKDYGIPRSEIADIHEAGDDAKRQALFKKVNEGKVRIVIGGTKNMGTGVNVQQRVVAMHHLDIPWTPADVNQRNGRGSRQGNEIARDYNNNQVDAYYYAVERTLDTYRYQLQDVKGKMIDSFKMANVGVNEFDEGGGDDNMSPAEMVAILSGNPVILDKAKQDKLVDKLKRLQRSSVTEYARRKSEYELLQKSQSTMQDLIRRNAEDIETLKRNGYEQDAEGNWPTLHPVLSEYERVSSGKTFEKPTELGAAIHARIKETGTAYLYAAGISAKVVPYVDSYGETKLGEYELQAQTYSGVRYTVKLSDDDTAAGQAMQNLLRKIYSNAEVYKRRLEEVNNKLEGADPGEYSFPRQAELDAALAKKREIDAEYNKLIVSDKKPKKTDETPEAQITNLDYPQFTNQTEAQQLATAALVEVLNDNTDLDVFLATDEEAQDVITTTHDASQVEHPMRSTYNTQGVTGETPELSMRRPFGGNSGYVGYSKSKRAVDAESRGLRNQSQMDSSFADRVNELIQANFPNAPKVTLKQIKDALDNIHADEWHHTSVYGNRTNYYSAETIAEYFTPETEDAKRQRESEEQLKAERIELTTEIEKEVFEAVPHEYKTFNRNGYDFESAFYRTTDGNLVEHYRGQRISENGIEDYKNIRLIPAGANYLVDDLDSWRFEHDDEYQKAKAEYNDARRKAYEAVSQEKKDRLKDITQRLREFMLTPDGTLYGWAIGDRIYLTKDGLNPNTPIHEYSHIWAKAMMRNNREGWQSIMDIFKGTPFWDEVVNDPNYQGLTTDDAICSEVLARYSGQRGAARMEEWAKEELYEAEQSGSVLQGAKIRRLISRAKKALADFWHWVGVNLFGIKHFDSAEQVADRVLYDMLNGTELGDVSNQYSQVATDAWNKYQYDGELESVRDVADYIEENMPKDATTQPLFDAIDKYRSEEEEDRMLYGERGDLEPFEDAIFAEIEKLMDSNIERSFSKWTPEQMKAIQEWNEAHPHPQYQVGEKLDHYAQRLSQWEEARKQFRASMSGAKPSAEEVEKADRPVAAGTPAFVPGVKPTPTADESPAEYALRLKQYYQLMRDENLVADYVAEINAQADAASKMLKKNTLVRGLLDAAKPIENFQEWMAQRGATMTDGSNAYTDTFLASGRVSQAHEQLTRDILRPLAKQIATIIAPDKATGKSRLDGINIVWHNMDVAGTGSKLDGKALTPREIIGVYCQAKDCAEAIEKGLPDRGAKGFLNNLGMSHDDIIAAVESVIPRAELDELWRLINAATHFALNYDYESGRISEDTHTEFYQREFYVPQRGWRERDESALVTEYEPVGKRGHDPYNAALVKAHGRQSLAADPFAYIMSIDASSIISSENNKIKQKFLRFCLDNEDLGLKTGAFRIKKYWIMNVIDPETGRIKLDADGNPMMEVSYSAPSTEDLQHDKETKQQIQEKRKQLSKVRSAFEKQNEHGDMPETLQAAYETKIARLEQSIEDLENQMHIAWHATNTNISQRTSDEKKQHEVQVLLDGEKYVIELQDEKLANAINKKFKQHQESLFDTTQKMRNATRFMSAMLTQYNPEFAASNFARDYQVALATLMAEHRELVGPFMKYFVTCQGAVWKYAFNDKVRDREAFANDEMGQYLREYFASGAPTGFSYMQDLKSLRRDFDAMVNESNVRRGIKGAVGVFAMLTEVSETAVRFAGFVAARKNGMGLNEAAYLSKELTTNFDRAGEASDTGWMAWFSFFRATLNGNLKFLKALKKMPLAYSLVAVSYFAMGMLNQFLNPDDPDDEIWASDYTRQSNFVLGKIRIPVAHFMRMFFGAGVNAAQWIQGTKSFGHSVYDTATFASNELLPNYLNVLGNGTEWNSREGNVDFTFTGLIQGAMPSPVSPITDVWFNRDFRGATINREPFTKAQEGKKDILMGKEYTLPIYKWLTQAVYEGVGGSMNTEYKSADPAWRSWLFDISPSSVEHVVEGYIPAGADMFITLGEAIYDAATGTPTGPDKWPFVRKFYNAYTPERAYMQQYYLLNGRVKEFKRVLDDYQKNDPAQYRLLRNSQQYRTYQQTQRLVKSQSENPTTADVQALIEANKLWLK